MRLTLSGVFSVALSALLAVVILGFVMLYAMRKSVEAAQIQLKASENLVRASDNLLQYQLEKNKSASTN